MGRGRGDAHDHVFHVVDDGLACGGDGGEEVLDEFEVVQRCVLCVRLRRCFGIEQGSDLGDEQRSPR